jgi:hypothetical protein
MTITDRPESGNPPGDLLGRRANPEGGRSISRGQGLWITLLALPLVALLLLLAEPDLDLHWEHHPSHFWLVLTVAAVNVTLGVVASEAASDATTHGPSSSRSRCWQARDSWDCTRLPHQACCSRT